MVQYEIRRWAFSSRTYEYETPLELFRVLDEEFHFTLDVCANKTNAKCKRFFDKDHNGLLQSWKGQICWMNPPYGKLLPDWMRKAYSETANGTTTVALVPCRTDTRWFWNYCIDQEIRLIKGRLRFKHGLYDGEPLIKDFGAPFPSMLVVFKPHNGHGLTE